MTSLTFHGGIHEIGGNKFLVEDKGTKIFLDFGMQMGKLNQYFAEFTQPRILAGMGDLFEFDLLPDVKGIYRRDHSKHMEYGDHDHETSVDGVLLTHAHVDHCAYIHYLRHDIPIYCTEASKSIMQGFQDMGGGEQYITYKENFKIYDNTKGGKSRATNDKNREEIERDIRIISDSKKFKIDSIEIEPIAIDHSLPGVCGFIIHTSSGTIGYTADIRFHGRRPHESQNFVDRCGKSSIDYLLCEGTRIKNTEPSITEFKVETDVQEMISDAEQLVICTYPIRDLDRFLSFYNAVKSTDRQMVINTKQAYLLKLFKESSTNSNLFPSPTDSNIKVYISRKRWGLLTKDVEYWTEDVRLADYNSWERPFLDYPNYIDYKEVSENQKKYVFYCSDFELKELIDIRPKEHSRYIRSSTEPFNEEMRLDHERVKRWLIHFKLLTKGKDWKTEHVSGHGTADQIKKIIDGAKSKKIIPIHTENESMFDSLHNNVQKVKMHETIQM